MEHLQYPFKDCTGFQITYNTDLLVKFLLKEFGFEIVDQRYDSKKWKKIIAQWCDGLNKGTKYLFLGRILSDIAETKESRNILKKGLQYATEYERGHIENELTRVALKRADYPSARVHLQKAIPIFKKYDKTIHLIEASSQLGWIEKQIGNYENAKKYFEQSLRASRKIDYQFGIACSLRDIAMIHQRIGSDDSLRMAEKMYKKSFAMSEEIGDLAGISRSLHQLGMIKRIKHDFDAAEKLLRRSLKIKTQIGDKSSLVASKCELAYILEEKNDYDSAEN